MFQSILPASSFISHAHRADFIDAFSLVIQVAVAFLAIRLIRITGRNMAWTMIAVAMLAMAVRRLGVLVGVAMADPNTLDLASAGTPRSASSMLR